MFRDTGLLETMNQSFTDNWQDALTQILPVQLKNKKALYGCCMMKHYSCFGGIFLYYAVNLRVSHLHHLCHNWKMIMLLRHSCVSKAETPKALCSI